MTRYNWVGFYFMEAPSFDALVLGPHAGSFVPHVRIPLDRGLCGAAATTGETVVVRPRWGRSALHRIGPGEIQYDSADQSEEPGDGGVVHRELLRGHLPSIGTGVRRVVRRAGRPVHGKRGAGSGEGRGEVALECFQRECTQRHF